MGNSRSSESGTGNKYCSHAFFVICMSVTGALTQKVFMIRFFFLLVNSAKTMLLCLVCLVSMVGVSSCSTTKTIGLTCQERQIEIYVDDEFLGRDLVYYRATQKIAN